MKASLFRTACLALSLAGLAACTPDPPPTDEPPEPKAGTAEATELRDAIKRPIEQAKAVETAAQEAAETQRADIDAATN